MYRVRIGDQTAVVNAYRWKSEDPKLEKLLNLLLDPMGPWPWDADPDKTAAEDACDSLGGEIV